MADALNRRRSWRHPASDLKHFLLIYNCYLEDDEVERSLSAVGESVTRALGLQNSEWPGFPDELRFLALRQVGVPLKAGYHFDAKLPSVLRSVLVLCEGPLATGSQSVTLCCPERNHPRRQGVRKGVVVHVVSKPREDVFAFWPDNLVCGLAGLHRLRGLTDQTWAALGAAAKAADQAVKDHISHRYASGKGKGKSLRGGGKGGKRSAVAAKKDYERELAASAETLRHLQRLRAVRTFKAQESPPPRGVTVAIGLL